VGTVEVRKKRLLVQLGFFMLFNAAILGAPLLPLFVPVLECPSMPYKTTLCVYGILQRNLSFEWAVVPFIPLATIAMILLFGALFGRALCGWACPLGFFQDAVSATMRFIKVKQRELSQKFNFMLSSIKYLVLFVTLSIVSSVGIAHVLNVMLGKKYAFSWGVCGRAPYCLICPVPVLFVTLPSLAASVFYGSSLPQLPITFYIGLAAFVIFIVASIATKRSWCRYVCPLGAMMGLFNRFSLLHIKKKPNTCTTFCRGHEKECREDCPMGLQVQRGEDPSSMVDCMMCYECADACRNKAVEFKLG
jgi:ferredoxin-type protein NapH